MNQLYGHQISLEGNDQTDLALDGLSPIEVPPSPHGFSPQVKISTYTETVLQAFFSRTHSAWVYIWGRPAHVQLSKAGIPEWCAGVVAGEHYEQIKQLLGSFVLIVDEPAKKRLTIVSDILGVRPLFLGNQNGRVIFGSNVWPLYRAGLISGSINYDAVSAWISYGFNCTNGSLFSDLNRLPSGSAVVIQSGEWKEITYARFEGNASLMSTDRVVEELHEIVSSTLSVLLANEPRATLALSGGYDSRYLLALALSLSKTDVQCVTVSNDREEGTIAHQVAKALRVPLETIPAKNSQWDLYDEPFHFTADGFPLTKFVTHLVAQRYPKIPMLNGYMGDSLIRGSKDTFQGKYEEEWPGDLTEILLRKHSFVSSVIFRPGIAKNIEMRSRMPMEEAVRKGLKIGKVFGWADFYFRQRLYISNNFLQHLDLAETLLPFYSWALLSYKMRYNCHIFNSKIYEQIFSRFFPALAKIPRAGHSRSQNFRQLKISRWTMQWALKLLPLLCNKKRLLLLDKKWCIPRTFAGMAGVQRYETSIHNLYRFYLLEDEARKTGVNFDWEKI